MVVGGDGSTLHGGEYFVGPSVVLACFGALIWVVMDIFWVVEGIF